MEKGIQTYKLPKGWANARIEDISVPSKRGKATCNKDHCNFSNF